MKNKDIAKDTGLSEVDISRALNNETLLRKDKLRKIVDAGYPLEPFVFGRSYLQDHDNSSETETSTTK